MAGEYGANSARRRTYSILTGIILLTLPCYCAGFIALSLAPAAPGGPPTATLLATITGQPAATGSATITFTPSPAQPSATLLATTTQFLPPTPTATNVPSATNTGTPT